MRSLQRVRVMLLRLQECQACIQETSDTTHLHASGGQSYPARARFEVGNFSKPDMTCTEYEQHAGSGPKEAPLNALLTSIAVSSQKLAALAAAATVDNATITTRNKVFLVPPLPRLSERREEFVPAQARDVGYDLPPIYQRRSNRNKMNAKRGTRLDQHGTQTVCSRQASRFPIGRTLGLQY